MGLHEGNEAQTARVHEFGRFLMRSRCATGF